MTTDYYMDWHFNKAAGKVEKSGRRKALQARVERIVAMDERRKELVEAGDREGLLRLAQEYVEARMPNMAQKVTLLAQGLRS